MKKTLMLLATGTVVVCAAACSKSSSKTGQTGLLANGTYTMSNSAVSPNTCNIPLSSATSNNGLTIAVTVSATAASLDFGGGGNPSVLSISGTALTTSSFSITSDWTTTGQQIATIGFNLSTGYNCVETDEQKYGGTITSQNHFNISSDFTTTMVSGSAGACLTAITSAGGLALLGTIPTGIPCESDFTFDAARTGP